MPRSKRAGGTVGPASLRAIDAKATGGMADKADVVSGVTDTLYDCSTFVDEGRLDDLMSLFVRTARSTQGEPSWAVIKSADSWRTS